MRTYSLLRLENNANRVIMSCDAECIKDAIEYFNVYLIQFKLDEHGYAKDEIVLPGVTFCVAEHYNPFEHHIVKGH